jgi:hypothetical protein
VFCTSSQKKTFAGALHVEYAVDEVAASLVAYFSASLGFVLSFITAPLSLTLSSTEVGQFTP